MRSGTIITMSDSHTLKCYHCGLPVASKMDMAVTINGEQQPMCCAGCQAVAQTIVNSGLEDFYRHRTAPSLTASDTVPEFLKQISVYDEPELQKSFVSSIGADQREAALILEGITCPACVWMNEQHLKTLPGIIDIQANFSTRRLRVRWNNGKLKLSQILQAIHEIGYTAYPYDPQQHQQMLDRERKLLLQRLGVAGILGMQVMMIAITLYTGEFSGDEEKYKHFFHWISLLLTMPVVLFSARAFFDPALRDLKHRKLGMDVPISLGILIAFIGSIKSTLSGVGEVYYDSVTMFVFLVLLARYLELVARKRATETSENLILMTPATAIRLQDSKQEIIPVARLNVGDRVLIRPGDTVPADGRIVEGRSTIDESLLSGESLPVIRQPGDPVIGGSINIESPLQVMVEHIGQDSLLSHISSLMERSQMEKPAIIQLADRVAAWFVPIIVLLAAVVGGFWWQKGDPHWFETMLSLLVVTCPCALSLATPAALTVATDTLMKLGILSTRGHAIETLARAGHFVFDKTGTLTEGVLQLNQVTPLADLTPDQCLNIAAALETHSEHPIAKAITGAADPDSDLNASAVSNIPGAGLNGSINGTNYFLGTADHIRLFSQTSLTDQLIESLDSKGHSLIFLADENRLLAAFLLLDNLRQDARKVVDLLKQRGKQLSILSGDNYSSVSGVAEKLGIASFDAGLKPDQKLQKLKDLQKKGEVVAMIGDGVNDAPVLAGAQVSMAMGSGAQIARANADLVLLKNQLPILADAISVTTKTVNIIRQNMSWAILYNLLAVPVAALGLIEPWMAAIGMSLSSLLVVTNALRIKSI